MANSKDGFLPKDYTPKQGEFMKLKEGDNNVRILSRPLIGKLWWVSPEGVVRDKSGGTKGDKPYRIEYKAKLPQDVLELQTKEFWMLKVWDYDSKGVKILEFTQQSILKALNEFISNPKWGDPRAYDINIKREGSGMDTKYYVMPSPPTILSKEIEDASQEAEIDLKGFLTPVDASDPFEGMEVDEQDVKDVKKNIKTSEPEEEITDDQLPF